MSDPDPGDVPIVLDVRDSTTNEPPPFIKSFTSNSITIYPTSTD
jgi:hypothetical protein